MIDPKPNLSAAAIKSNCEYYQSLCEQYRQKHQEALQELIKWEQQLNEISPNTNK